MRVVKLSDHSGDELDKARTRRRAEHSQAEQAWGMAVRRRQEAIEAHAQATAAAWRAGRLLAAAIEGLRWLSARLSSKPAAPVLACASDEEERLAAGRQGEARVLESLAAAFDDRWIAFQGYFNRGGETDLLLVGPAAVAAIEVKCLRGTVHCTGAVWTRDKTDRFGNVVERGQPVRDAKGRAPSQQVNAVADALQAQFARKGYAVKVKRAVILAHDASQLGTVREPGVDLIAAIADPRLHEHWRLLVQSSGGESFDVEQLGRIVSADHAFHTREQSRRLQHAQQGGHGDGSTHDWAGVRPAPTAGAHRPQRIKLAPPSEEALSPMTDLEFRQADGVATDVAALGRSGGHDPDLDRKLRQAISGQLQNGGRFRALSVARGSLELTRDKVLLDRLIAECRQTVDLEDRRVTAVVVPLAIRWRTPAGADWSGVELAEGDRSSFGVPCQRVAGVLDADEVVFSARLYEGGRLLALDPRLLRKALLQIEVGEEPTVPELKAVPLRPQPGADWQIRYMLGVVVTQPQQTVRVDDEETQQALAGQLDLFVDAFTWPALLATGTKDAARAQVEGVWTLDAGIKRGRRLQRQHRIESLLAQFTVRPQPLDCWFVLDKERAAIRLLTAQADVRTQHTLPMLDGDECSGAIRKLLQSAAFAQLPAGPAVRLHEMGLHDFQRQLRSFGMTWVGRAD